MIISLTVLHYGKDYLRWALRSVRDYVDACYVLYSPHGSHGYQPDEACPEERHELYVEAILGAGRKLRWFDGNWRQENEHRGAIHQICPEAKQIIVLDADEIWPEDLIRHALEWATEFREYRSELVHFWRSFRRAVIDDQAAPVRVINTLCRHGSHSALANSEHGRIAHMGYAQNEAITAYKQLTHGHRADWRSDWFESRFLANAQTDCHPTNVNYWTPVEVNPLDYLPTWMETHPYYGREVIA